MKPKQKSIGHSHWNVARKVRFIPENENLISNFECFLYGQNPWYWNEANFINMIDWLKLIKLSIVGVTSIIAY